MKPWTDDQLAAFNAKNKRKKPPKPDSAGIVMARAVNTRPERRNKTEIRYGDYLEAQKKAGEIAAYQFEPMRLRIGESDVPGDKDAFYKPDYLVIGKDGRVMFDEIKGFEREAAMVRIKAAAMRNPWFVFRLVKWVDGAWDIRVV